jgi:hypothetical protein
MSYFKNNLDKNKELYFTYPFGQKLIMDFNQIGLAGHSK